MAHSDSDEDAEANDGFDFDGRSSEADEVNEDDLFDADENVDEATEHGEVRLLNSISCNISTQTWDIWNVGDRN